MNYNIIINSIKSVESLDNSWSNKDLTALLERFDFPDATTVKPEELQEFLFMAINDFEPAQAATILLDYKLSEQLNEGQIEQISHDMLLDKVAEEYPDISLHYNLFNINQLLYKAYNGKFPNTKATVVTFQIDSKTKNDSVISKELVLKAFSKTLSDNNIIKRLFEDQLSGKKPFDEAENIIWNLTPQDNNSYTLTTSEYWMSKDEFLTAEFDVEIIPFEDDEQE